MGMQPYSKKVGLTHGSVVVEVVEEEGWSIDEGNHSKRLGGCTSVHIVICNSSSRRWGSKHEREVVVAEGWSTHESARGRRMSSW